MATMTTTTMKLRCNFIKLPLHTRTRQLQKIKIFQRHLASDTSADEKNVLKCPYQNSVVPVTNNTLSEVLFSNLPKWENAPAFECAVTGRKYSFLDVYKFSRSFATALIESGLRKGDVVAVCLPNLPEYPIVANGIWTAGLIMTTVNPTYTKDEIQHQMEMSQAKCVVTITKCLPVWTAVKNIPGCHVKSTIVIDKETLAGTHSFFQMIKTKPNDRHFLTGKGSFDARENVACILCSSGTTGLPKGVVLTHSNLATNALQYSNPPALSPIRSKPENEQGRLIGMLPFFHVYGLTTVLNTNLIIGFHCMTLPGFDKDTFCNVFRKHKPCYVQLVPPLVSFIVNSPTFTKEYLQPVQIIVIGAAPAGESLINKVLEKSGKYILMQEGYGMTESSPVAVFTTFGTKNKKIGSIGVPVASTMVKIVDGKTGKALGARERGELFIKGPQVMKGYLNNPRATAETIDKDGWLHTGDVGYYDEDGYIYLVDRMKELIKVKGYQVSPSELEDELRKLNGILDCAVIGVQIKKGEAPRAYIVRKDDQITEETVHKFMKEKLSDYKQLNGGIEFVKEIPKNASGKILKKQILKEYNDKYGSSK